MDALLTAIPPLWTISAALVAIAAVILMLSALKPPIYRRRVLTALVFAPIGAVYLGLGWIGDLRLPLQAVVFADCAVLDEANFVADVHRLQDGPGLLKDVSLWTMGTCPDAPAQVAGLAVQTRPGVPSADRAVDEARTLLDAGRPRAWSEGPWPRRWATPRIVLAYAPGGPLSPTAETAEGAGGAFGNSLNTSALADGRVPDVRAVGYGATRVGAVRLDIVPGVLLDDDNRRVIRLEVIDARLEAATGVRLDIEVASPNGHRACVLRDTSESLAFQIASNGEISLAPGTGAAAHATLTRSGDGPRRLVITVLETFSPTRCDAENVVQSWLSVTARAAIELSSGATIRAGGIAMAPIAPTRGFTLVTPDPNDTTLDRAAAAGWQFGPGENADTPGVSAVLQMLFEELCREPGCMPAPRHMLEETERCRFRGIADVSSRRDEFDDCLDRTERLVAIGLRISDLAQLDGAASPSIEARTNAGTLHVMVAAPVPDAATTTPPWAPTLAAQPLLRTDMRLLVSLSHRDRLRMRDAQGRSGWRAQQDFVQGLVNSGVLGAATITADAPNSYGMRMCVPGEPLSANPLAAWIRDDTRPLRAPDLSALDARPQPRLRARVHVQRVDTPNDTRQSARGYVTDLVCRGPVLRLYQALQTLHNDGALASDTQTPRAAVVVMADDGLHADRATVERLAEICGTNSFDAEVFANRLRAFALTGGRVWLTAVADARNLPDDSSVASAYPELTLTPLQSLADDLEAHAGGSRAVQLLIAPALEPAAAGGNGGGATATARALIAAEQSRWGGDRRLRGVFTGDAGLVPRDALCAVDTIVDSGVPGAPVIFSDRHCAFAPPPYTGALDRSAPTPESTRMLAPADDPFVSARWRLCDGSEIASSRPHGLGRAVALGFSPLSRDLLAPDISDTGPILPPGVPVSASRALLLHGQCFLQSDGRRTRMRVFHAVAPLRPNEAERTQERGGLKMLAAFMGLAGVDRPAGAPRVASVTLDPGSRRLRVTASAEAGGDWRWTPGASLNGTELPVRFVSTDRDSGRAIFEVAAEGAARGLLWLSLATPDEGTSPWVELIPVHFDAAQQVPTLPTRIAAFYDAEPLPLDPRSAALLLMLAITLLLFSPLLRVSEGWRRIARLAVPHPPDAAERPAARAPLFDLSASLAEWGAHPGQPIAIRGAGLPAGRRNWRSGDAGGAIRLATAFPLVARGLGMPVRLPMVNLKTAPEAVDVIVLLEASGALRSPAPRRAPAKLDFAARLGCFLAHAVSNVSGVAAVKVGAAPAQPTVTPDETEALLRHDLKGAASAVTLIDALADAQLAGRLVYLVCDGLAFDVSQAMALDDLLTAEGGQLRVAVVTSPDDRDAVGLSRDPFTGSFRDDSETAPETLIAARDGRLAAAQFQLSRRGVKMVCIAVDVTPSELLTNLNNADFLK